MCCNLFTLCPVVLCGCKSCTLKKAEHRRIDAFELWCWRRLFRVPWTVRRSNQPFNPKGNQPRIFTGRTDAEAEAPILWLLNGKSKLIRKDPDAGKDWGQEKKGKTKDKMVGWHQRLNGHESEQTPRDGEGQGSLVCCSPWCRGVGHGNNKFALISPKSAWVFGWIMTMDKLLLVIQLPWKCFLLCSSKVCPILKC